MGNKIDEMLIFSANISSDRNGSKKDFNISWTIPSELYLPDPIAASRAIIDLKAQMALTFFLTGAPDIAHFREVGGRFGVGD